MHAGVSMRSCCTAAEEYSADQWEEDVSGRIHAPVRSQNILYACMPWALVAASQPHWHARHHMKALM